MKSIEIFEFKQAIKNFVSQSDIPDEVKRMVLSEILKEQEEITFETLKREISERDKEGSKDGNAESV